MAYCKAYEDLENDEQVEIIAKLIHAIQKDESCFHRALHIIIYARENGIYKGVKFGRDAILNEVQPDAD